jgi:hypothetical protein
MLREIFDNVSEEKDQLNKKVKTQLYTSCKDALDNGERTSGVYRLLMKTTWRTIRVYCDQTTSGGGWMVFQRRVDGSENFDRDWSDYKEGFGNLEREFWLGNELVHEITSSKKHELLIEIKDFFGHLAYVSYGTFKIYSESNSYMIDVHEFLGENKYRNIRNKWKFSTRDKSHNSSCARSSKSGWWFSLKCMDFPNMNIHFINVLWKNRYQPFGILEYRNGKEMVQAVEMKIREKDI